MNSWQRHADNKTSRWDQGELARAADIVFARSHKQAVALFEASAGSMRSYSASAIGPDGESLRVDCSWIGADDADRVLVLVSGTHGVEGFCGSGIQVDWLRRNRDAYDVNGVAVLLIHALNPYGFAWDRRVTSEGADLNRNFVDFAALPSNPLYPEIANLLLPEELDEETVAAAENALAAWRSEHGELNFQIARKSGQFADPRGMFYGGTEPTEARLTLERIAADFGLADRRFVSVLDFHTGLGPFGYGEAQSEHEPTSASHAIATEVFGPSLTSPALGTSFSVPLHGTMQSFWDRLIPDGRHLYICLEFGTFDQEASRIAYRMDHWHHGHGGGDPHSAFGRAIRGRMRDHFYPDRPDWREMILMRARQVIGQALDHLRDIPPA